MEINSLQDYISYIDGLENFALDVPMAGMFNVFRGQANKEWKLSPSLYRNNLFYAENLLLTHLKRICPTEVLDNRFDTLVKMQHFGLPTRLLDVTLNPLVALYFACNMEYDKDGSVYIYKRNVGFWQNSTIIIDLFMDYIFDCSPTNIDLIEFLNKENSKYELDQRAGYIRNVDELKDILSKTWLIIPDKTNKRIDRQDGCFFLFGMDFEICNKSSKLGEKFYNAKPIADPDFSYEKLLVPSSKKKGIISQLSKMGINEASLFPDIEHQIKYTIEIVKERMIKTNTIQ